MKPDQTITLSIEPVEGPTYQHGFHLGTMEVVARQLAEEQFYARKDIRTVALIRNRRILDVFDGRWFSDFEQQYRKLRDLRRGGDQI